MSKKKEKKRRPGRPWDGVKRVKPRIARLVRFPPEDNDLLIEAAIKANEAVESFIKEAVRERAMKILKKT
jgi:uncharacterized protein (DUF1778 family)